MAAAAATERALAAIAARDDEIHAFVDVFADAARARAAELDRLADEGVSAGPLHGVPVSVKDLFAVAGSTTRAGSAAYARLDTEDAPAVARLRAAGAVLIGRTALHEFAMGVVTPGVNNPHDATRIAGGSSGGAAAAVAAGMGALALGSDTRGSIRVPAAFCGVVGLKPTYEAVPLEGALPLSWSLDHAGPIAESVAAAAAGFAVLSGQPVGRPAREELNGLRAGVARAAWRDAEPAVEHALAQALDALADAGITLNDVERPSAEDFDSSNRVSVRLTRPEAAALHRTLALDRSLYTDEVRRQLERAEEVRAVDYIDAVRERERLRGELLACFEGSDVLLMPTLPLVAPPHAGAIELSRLITRNVAIWSFVGFPALSVPCGRSADGLPVGIQIVGAPHAEATILSVGQAVESALR